MAKGRKPPKPGTDSPTLPKITGFKATRTLIGIYLEWDAFPGATSYWVHRDEYVPAIIQDLNYTDKYIEAGKTYVYYIRAVVNGVIGAKSDSVTVNT